MTLLRTVTKEEVEWAKNEMPKENINDTICQAIRELYESIDNEIDKDKCLRVYVLAKRMDRKLREYVNESRIRKAIEGEE